MMTVIISHHDVSPLWHSRFSLLMEMFVATFKDSIPVGGDFVAGDLRREEVGRIVRIEKRGLDLWGEVRWHGEAPAGYVKVSWSLGPGERVDLTSAFVSAHPHALAWEEDDVGEEDEPEDWSDDDEGDDYAEERGYW
jgi:hypothetical protein